MLNQLPFKIYKRTLKSKKVLFYVKFLMPNGKYTAGRSTGEISKRKAELKAWEYLKNGNPVSSQNQKIKDFAKNFFDWDGEWAVSKRAAGKRLSLDQCKKNNRLVEKHINRVLGEVKFSDIDTALVRKFRNQLYTEGYAGSTINKVLGCLKSILETAEEFHLLRGMPRIERAALNQKETGILSVEEVQELFSTEWPDFRAFAGNLLAASTGFRLGEILGIRIGDVQIGHIKIRGSWNTKYGYFKEGTKNGQASRSVPIPKNVQNAINELIEKNPWPYSKENFLLYSPTSPYMPMQERVLTHGFKEALSKIGIDEFTRKQRNLKFHSHRHFFNSLLIESRIPLQKIQRLTGHLSDSMTQRYYHTNDLTDVGNAVQGVFKNVLPFKKAE